MYTEEVWNPFLRVMLTVIKSWQQTWRKTFRHHHHLSRGLIKNKTKSLSFFRIVSVLIPPAFFSIHYFKNRFHDEITYSKYSGFLINFSETSSFKNKSRDTIKPLMNFELHYNLWEDTSISNIEWSRHWNLSMKGQKE